MFILSFTEDTFQIRCKYDSIDAVTEVTGVLYKKYEIRNTGEMKSYLMIRLVAQM
jgi:hypothetical protein